MEEKKILVNDENINVAKEEEAGLFTVPDDSNAAMVCC